MRSPAVTIERSATLRSAATALRDASVGTLAVMDDSSVAGVVSEHDIVRALADGADPDHAEVMDVMSEQPRYLTTGEEERPLSR
jgi:CBS domain-containing protein